VSDHGEKPWGASVFGTGVESVSRSFESWRHKASGILMIGAAFFFTVLWIVTLYTLIPCLSSTGPTLGEKIARGQAECPIFLYAHKRQFDAAFHQPSADFRLFGIGPIVVVDEDVIRPKLVVPFWFIVLTLTVRGAYLLLSNPAHPAATTRISN